MGALTGQGKRWQGSGGVCLRGSYFIPGRAQGDAGVLLQTPSREQGSKSLTRVPLLRLSGTVKAKVEETDYLCHYRTLTDPYSCCILSPLPFVVKQRLV